MTPLLTPPFASGPCRLKGPDSKLCPWLALLPKSFSTTLFFSEQELGWLKGTTLHTATRWVRASHESYVDLSGEAGSTNRWCLAENGLVDLVLAGQGYCP